MPYSISWPVPMVRLSSAMSVLRLVKIRPAQYEAGLADCGRNNTVLPPLLCPCGFARLARIGTYRGAIFQHAGYVSLNAQQQGAHAMAGMLSDQELAALTPSELCPHRTPIPTQAVSSDEYYPGAAE
jgi:hypothetical protein